MQDTLECVGVLLRTMDLIVASGKLAGQPSVLPSLMSTTFARFVGASLVSAAPAGCTFHGACVPGHRLGGPAV